MAARTQYYPGRQFFALAACSQQPSACSKNRYAGASSLFIRSMMPWYLIKGLTCDTMRG